eukprot:TRINITY_DN22745_c0_g1_i4.p1 TRINITY_DN22745_c0_g1~~TRINITY_DN22745_c0_g1_i4.p1  ORF type:complete len:292 (-),score=43.92 TRINITY_DN22745_c0_g1_i4:9-884(-)
MNQYHHVFWLGDLNYRLDYGQQGEKKKPTKEQFEQMVAIIEKKEGKELFSYDQLAKEMKEKRVFVGFNEGSPWKFPPTFKVKRGMTRQYVEERSPAWCDRILWRSFEGYVADQTSYNSCEQITTSDHKPVFSVFNLPFFRLPDATDFTLGPCSLQITKLKAYDLPVGDVGGTSDPFVEFYGAFVNENHVRTSVKKKTLEPVWDDKEVPIMLLTVNSKVRLEHSFLFVRVFDYDFGKPDELLASGVLPLNTKDSLSGKITPFSVPLSSCGLPAGRLVGEMQLIWEESVFVAS